MSVSVFNQQYADQYDLLYGEKDYEAECNLLEQVFKQYGVSVKSILDLGCGTGNHSIPLARRGFQVTGVDLSENMLAHAREKAGSSSSPVFILGDARSVDLAKRFDVVLMMFAVLGYQLTNEDVLAALNTVRKHLNPGGLFVFDVWYGPAVLAIRPSERIKVIPTSDGKVIRAASGSLDTACHLAEVKYHLWRISGDKVVSETEEAHQMRYFFPQELALFLSSCGLALQKITAFPSLDRPADETSWNVIAIGSLGKTTILA
jgi:SAM-dependent methyltransferase